MSALYHHGIKGMKWGVRHDDDRHGGNQNHSNIKKVKKKRDLYRDNRKNREEDYVMYKGKKYHKDYLTAHSKLDGKKRKSVKEMSDIELKKRYQRLKMEEYYEKHEDKPMNNAIKYAGIGAAVSAFLIKNKKTLGAIKTGAERAAQAARGAARAARAARH